MPRVAHRRSSFHPPERFHTAERESHSVSGNIHTLRYMRYHGAAMPELLVSAVNLLGFGALALLVWSLKRFVTSHIQANAEELGRIDARLQSIDRIVAVETRLRQAAGEVELGIKRRLDSESAVRSKYIDFRERQLAEFYWPLYICLQMNNTIWHWFEQITAESPERHRQLAVKLEQTFTLPNHRKALKIIEAKIHLMERDSRLEHLLLLYVRHIAIFQALRALDIKDKDPIDFGEPWPKELFPILAKETNKRQEEFDALLRQHAQQAGDI